MTISAYFQRAHQSAVTVSKHLLLLVFVLLLAMPGKSFAGVADTAEALSEKTIGSPDAKVVIHEYASLTCSHCANFHTNVLPEIKKNYVDTGKVRIVYHDFPLDDLALAASMLARCAGNDKFFPM
ncbi:MAG: DsbA family protein, partial [Rhodospirillaceae bacterium]|nr:DsbA family protein [Rhodospirillaceae bacterium]